MSNVIVVDRETSEKLRAAGAVVELRDEAGELLGYLEKPIKRSDNTTERGLPDAS